MSTNKDIPLRTVEQVNLRSNSFNLYLGPSQADAQQCAAYWREHVRVAVVQPTTDLWAAQTFRGQQGLVGFDLDGTLAQAHGHNDWPAIGLPVLPMVRRAHFYIGRGQELAIFTARGGEPQQQALVQSWLWEHLRLQCLITNVKRYDFVSFYDDRATHIVPNTGLTLVELADDGK